MNILFVSARFPLPLDTGSKIRTFNLLKSAASAHAVTLVTFSEDPEDREYLSELYEFCEEVVLVPKQKASRRQVAAYVTANLFSPRPYSISRYASATMKATLEELLAEGDFDLIHCGHIHVAQNLPAVPVPRIVDEHNVEATIALRVAQQSLNPLFKAFMYIQWQKYLRYEPLVCSQFDRCLTVSAEDRGALLALNPNLAITVIENGVDVQYYQQGIRPTDANRLVFTGSMDWLPNDDAMTYFCRSALPAISREAPDVRLSIVGRNPSSAVRSLHSPPRVTVTGSVPDVRPYVERSTVFVVPLRIGGGSRLKILEAMAMGKPCVSTSVGCEGLRVTPGHNILIADAPQDFAAEVVRLLGDRYARAAVSRAGRELVLAEYSWTQIGKRLLDAYSSVTGRAVVRRRQAA